jgi:hypothetical protein
MTLLCGSPASADELLRAEPPLVLEGTHGKFDFLAIDAAGRRLLAAHTGNASLDVIDLDSHKLIKSVATGAAQDSAVDAEGGRYLVASSKPPQVAVVDAAKLAVVSTIPLPAAADLLVFNSKTKQAYVDHDDGKDFWIVDPAAGKIVATVSLPGDSPEDLAIDSSFTRLIQCMKNGNLVAEVDLASNKVTHSWPTAPVAAPHGMALLPESHAFLVVGGNGKLVLMSDKDGQVLSSTDVPMRVDQIAYDHESHRVYCASGTGKIGVAKLEDGKLSTLGEVPSSEGCHSIAVDPKTHQVWIAYAKGTQSMVQCFTPVK